MENAPRKGAASHPNPYLFHRPPSMAEHRQLQALCQSQLRLKPDLLARSGRCTGETVQPNLTDGNGAMGGDPLRKRSSADRCRLFVSKRPSRLGLGPGVRCIDKAGVNTPGVEYPRQPG